MTKNSMISRISFVAAVAFLLLSVNLFAQDDKSKRPSPPANVSEMVGKTKVTIDYSQPSVKGRKIWGELVPYGKVWRTGANEATTFEVSTDVKIEGKTLAAGKYGLFTIPGESEWTVIFNSVPEQWGAFRYEEGKDVLRVMVKPVKSQKMNEKLTFTIDKNGKVALLWENLEVDFKVTGSK